MQHSVRQQQCKTEDSDRSVMPEFYMPAMWPVELQQWVVDGFVAWRKRRLYRRLLRLTDRQLRRWDLSRPRIIEKAEMPLRQVIAEQRSQRAHENCQLGQ